jgi:hypothetical protein
MRGVGQQYPPDLADYVLAHWPADTAVRFSREILCEALSECFQASLAAEEGRTTTFRLLLTEPERLPEDGTPNLGVLRLTFDHRRPLSAEELRRLAPATPFESSLIGASVEDGKLRIWGLAHSGPAWLAPTWGGRSTVLDWTDDPIIHVAGPGRLAVRRAGHLIGGLERGALVDTAMDVFESTWLPELFAREREKLQSIHAAHQERSPAPTVVESSLIGKVSQHMLRRVIQLVRGARHGGIVLVADRSGWGPAQDLGALKLKYRFHDAEPPRRFQTLLFELLERLADGTTKPSVGWADFARDLSPELERLERAIFEMSRLIAGLAATDGAVVLNKRFEILGFGAEVSAELPSPPRVWQALDIQGHDLRSDEVESLGTRHRAAYRFVNEHPDGLAIVISQDGAVRFVARRRGEVVYWEQSLSP